VINGEVVPQTVPLEKQRVLLSGQTVLSDAMRRGQLEKLPTFIGAESPLSDLRRMLTIAPVGKDLSSDALEIICEGGVKEDLQGILNQVVASYINAIEKDSEISGKESVELIERLQKSLLEDQKRDQDRYYQLQKELNLTAENDKGRWINPYVTEIEKLRLARDEVVSEFRQADQQLEQLKVAIQDTSGGDEKIRLAVIEAKKYFNLDKQQPGIDLFNPMTDEDRQRLIRYEQRMESANADMVVLEAERQEALNRYGARHPQVEFVEAKYQAAVQTRKKLNEELETLKDLLRDEEEISKKSEALTKEVRTRDQEIMQLYATALTNQRDRSKYNLDRLSEDIADLTTNNCTRYFTPALPSPSIVVIVE
jgi:chromosome segregation ATPase